MSDKLLIGQRVFCGSSNIVTIVGYQYHERVLTGYTVKTINDTVTTAPVALIKPLPNGQL